MKEERIKSYIETGLCPFSIEFLEEAFEDDRNVCDGASCSYRPLCLERLGLVETEEAK